MGRKYQWKTRFGSAILAASMLSTILPFQVIAAAADEDSKPVSVRWEPQTQTEDGKVNVDLTVELNPQDGSTLTAAMVEISLDSEEADALQWNGTSISVSELGTQEDDENQDSGETTTITPPATEEGKDETDTTQTSESTATPATGDGTGGATQSDPEEEKDETDTTQTTTTTTPGADGGTDETATTTPDETSAQLLTVPEARSDTGDPSAVLIKKEGGGAVLRILANAADSTATLEADTSGEKPAYKTELTFKTTTDQEQREINVAKEDIRVKTYPAESEETELPNITEAELLTETVTNDVFIQTVKFTVYADIPDEIAVSADPEKSVDLDGTGEEANKDATYTIKIRKTAVTDKDGKAYTFAVTLPTGLSLPAGEITLENGSIKCGETEIASLNLPEGLTLKEGSLQKNEDTGFTFTVTVPKASGNETVKDTHDITLTLHAGALVRTPDTVTGNITLTVSAAEGTEQVSDSADVSVNAEGATLPGEGGWDVVASELTPLNQKVFWRDNEETASRPGELGDNNNNNDAAYWKENVDLYYTLTDDTSAVYERVLLDKENEASWRNLGLTAYPTFTADASGFTVTGLPETIELVNPNDHAQVQHAYTVSWSMEPPDEVEHYAFRDIKASEIGEDKTYPSLEKGAEGWYYMLEDTFTFTLEVRQGDKTIEQNDVDELLKQFQFNWSYGTNPVRSDKSALSDLIEQGYAEVQPIKDGTVTITGMWKYNVDGSPIKYTITEALEEEESADYKIPASDLPEGPGLVDEDDWYQIHYNNAGVSGDGQDTTALYSGGTLQLVRQGNTKYEATKIWLDSYENGEGRPDATYTLYRYIEGKDPSTASQLTEYVVEAVKSGEGEEITTGGLTLQVYAADDVGENGNINEDAEPVQLPKYDTSDGREYIYVVRERLEGNNASQYEQVFGTVTVDDEGNVVETPEPLPAGALPDENNNTRPSGNTYLYSGGTLTNYQTNTIPVNATKTWNAAAYQSKFDNVAVELTLQYRVKDSGESWNDYTDAAGEKVVRYLHNFYAESLSDSLEEVPSMPQYATTNGEATTLTTNQELEYRWLETAVYTGAEVAENAGQKQEPSSGKKQEIIYPESGDQSATGNDPQGTITLDGSPYTVTYKFGENNSTQITNKVSEYLNYHVEKQWLDGSNPELITIQILRSVAGSGFTDYLEFTMKDGGEGKVEVKQTFPTDEGDPDGVSPDFAIEPDAVVKPGETTGDNTTEGSSVTKWYATVKDLPRFDEQGRPYEYLLLEEGGFPTYETTIEDNGDITTTVINGDDGGGGFNLLVRKVWLDDGDAEHREPVTFTLYYKNGDNAGEPVKRKVNDKNEEPYTIELGGENEENLWHKVVWIDAGQFVTDEDLDEIDADDVYLVETKVGDNEVNHNLAGEGGQTDTPTYDKLYTEQSENGPIFDVKTQYHRYQVTYKQEPTPPEGVGASFTITNRRLGNIDVQVTKEWVDGSTGTTEGNTSAAIEAIKEVLEGYAKEKDTYLALAFRLKFDESMYTVEGEGGNKTTPNDWEITYNGPNRGGDTVSVGAGAENVPIYGAYSEAAKEFLGPNESDGTVGENNPAPDYEHRYDDNSKTSSDQIILGWTKPSDGSTLTEGNWVYNDTANFLGLPKYDTSGNVVAYSVEEVWLKLGDDGKYEVVTLSDKNYKDLYNLWKDFSYSSTVRYEPNEDGKHTWDVQTMAFTNTRGGTKNVSWTVEWQDDFTNNSNLRPDIYLDVYRVAYTYNKDGTRTPVIERVTNTVDWTKPADGGDWTATVSGVPAYDEQGHEIFYYAVERTVMSAGDYDYQAAKYQMGEGATPIDLGTRDEAAEGVSVLNSTTGADSIIDDNNQPYNLLVLGKANESDPEDSIAWNDSGKPTNIGPFNPAPGSEGNYPKYALLEGGTIINTLANTFSIEGVKYWTGLPANWNTESRLPGVTFNVYRSTEPATETGSGEDEKGDLVAKLVISSDLWKELQVGTQYQYSILYEGLNVLYKDGDEVKVEVYEDVNTDLTDENAKPLPKEEWVKLPRYEEGTGKLWHYTVDEVVDYGEGKGPAEGQMIFVSEKSGSGFTFTNNYAPTTGTIEVKKYLYLPMKDDGTPASYPAVTFRLERWLEDTDSTEDSGGENQNYKLDGWSENVTLTTEQVKAIWTEEEDDDSVLNGSGNTANVIASGNNEESNYIWATLQFSDLPLYAPDGTEYQYSISEVKTYLNGYDTWGKAEDVTNPENEFTGEKLAVTNGVTEPIQFLTPTKSTTGEGGTGTTTTVTVDATFKNQQPEKPEKYEMFTATKIWEDNDDDSGFRPTTDAFKGMLTLTRTAEAQGGTGGAEKMEQELVLDKDYGISIEPENSDSNIWTITITPMGEGGFEKYAPNGMPWTYTLSEPLGEEGENAGRLQITDKGNSDQDKIYTPSTENRKTDGTWENPINDQSKPVPEGSNTYSFGELTNSIMTLAKFEKKWVGADDKPISANYLGFDLTVNFQLQVKATTETEWKKASVWTYDNGTSLGLSENDVTNSLTGPVADGDTMDKSGDETTPAWTYTFEDLPSAVKDKDGSYIFLEYRVIETKVSWAGNTESQSQTIGLPTDESSEDSNDNTFDYIVNPSSLVTGAEFSHNTNTSTTTNTLDTTSVSVTKVWSDGGNQYNTRPGADGPWSWESWFVLQRSTTPNVEDSWEEVALFEYLYGKNENNDEAAADGRWEDTISGLPTIDKDGKKYHYRVRELQPKAGGYTDADLETIDETTVIVQPDGIYNPDGFNYTTTYKGPEEEAEGEGSTLWTVTNALDSDDTEEVPANIEVKKDWAGEEGNGGIQSVTFQLQYKTEGSEWASAEFLTKGQHEKTATANDWTVSWTDLPATDNSGNEITGYRVIEEPGTGWVQIAEPTVEHAEDTNTTTYSYTFTNSIVTSFRVEKTWNPDKVGPEGASVTVGLYRTTDVTAVGSTTGATVEAVPKNELSDSTQQTKTLNTGNSWTATFTNLPKYNKDGHPYYYYALELDGENQPIADNGSITLNGSEFHVDYNHPKYDDSLPTDGDDSTIITNTPATSITGTKKWVDNSNAYDTRPGDLTLNLYRTTDTDPNDSTQWEDVSNIYAPAWEKETNGDTNVWTYTYNGLPQYDAEGNPYTYKVKEDDVPTGYKEANNGAGVKEEGATAPDFTNTLTGTVTIKGTKSWQGGTGTEPTLTLYRRLAGGTEAEWGPVTVDGTAVTPTWSEADSDTWTYQYSDLPKYNNEGVMYEYRVIENVPGDYDVYYKDGSASNGNNTNGTEPDVENMAITNVKRGALTVTKRVTGNIGDHDQQFDFKVTFTLPNDYEEADNTVPTITITKDGVEQPSETFSDGTATVSFTLADEESITFSNLPGNTHYVVEETNPYGHTVNAVNEDSTIPPGSTATAAFTNHKNYSGGGGGGDPENPPDEDIPDEPTPDEDIPPDEPDVPDEPDEPDNPDNPDEPDEPDEDIPDEPTPGEDVPPDEPSTPGEPGTPGTPGTPSEPGLPQTGQLWWPVGLLIAAGAAMIVTGVWNLKRYRGKHGKKKV